MDPVDSGPLTGGLAPGLVEGLLRICEGDFSFRMPRTFARDEADAAAFVFNAIAEELERIILSARLQERRLASCLDRMADALVQVAAGDLTVQVERDFTGDSPDVLAYLVNNTITELAAYVASATRKAEEDRLRLEQLVAERTLELERLAAIDPLTGVCNRRRFFEAAEAERARAARYSRPICLLMLDVDHFKAVNDRFGHDIGDKVLTSFTSTLRAQLRQHDQIGRYGGEEFVVLLPETELSEGQVLAERLRVAVELLDVRSGDEVVPLSVSIGAACWKRDETIDDALRRADRALYAAKAAGRNRVAVEA